MPRPRRLPRTATSEPLVATRVRIYADEKRAAEALARTRRTTFSEVVRQALRRELAAARQVAD